MPSNPRKADPLVSITAGMGVGSIQLERIEDEQEKAQRLRKDMLRFYFRDLSIWVIGCLFVVLTGLDCFWVLIRAESLPVDKDRAWSALMAILGGIVGLLFRKVAT